MAEAIGAHGREAGGQHLGEIVAVVVLLVAGELAQESDERVTALVLGGGVWVRAPMFAAARALLKESFPTKSAVSGEGVEMVQSGLV